MHKAIVRFLHSALGALVLASAAVAASRPEPIGPRPDRQIDESSVTYFVGVDGDDTHDGRTRATAFATLQKAADIVQAGQTVLVTRGVYRQGVHIKAEGQADAWISFVAEPGAEIRGSEVRKDWKPVDGLPGVYADAQIFQDPERFDFRLTSEGESLARRIGFDPAALRLNWSEYYILEDSRQTQRPAMTFTPIDLADVFNRALTDETAGDDLGGWTDQGHDDLSMLAVGRQTLDGVEYLLGSQTNGAILLDTPHVRSGGFPDAVSLPVAGDFDELRFLYTAA